MNKNKKYSAYGLLILWAILALITATGYLTSNIDNAIAAEEIKKDKAVVKKVDNIEPEQNIEPEKEKKAKKEEFNEAKEETDENKKVYKTLTMVATAYTADPAENGPWGAVAYDGQTLRRGIVAVDPNIIPMGTRLYIEGYGEAIAADQGSAIKGNRIDLFMDSKTEAYNWGMRTVKVIVLD
ncbi:MAG: 3D domain-containing protein [Thermosyntropha sp.]|nr:3D domain-containing protein [Thermosyntropha sp.]